MTVIIEFNNGMDSKIEKVKINYRGNKITARNLIVSSVFHININEAWHEVQKSALLEFICKGKVKFKPITIKFPTYWKEGLSVKTKMLLYGFIPFGGIHTITFSKIDSKKFTIVTKENDAIVKLWNHKIFIEKIDENRIRYTDKIELYAGILTSFVSYWAKSFYEHRQKRWQLFVSNVNEGV
ncbi:hypothetical protein EGM88_02820 [Aureibaculum marinum]|uniref:Uncharacterized protein n=1 Tax=Aureibaculum marinum TaxID=2487930 RepID=A0A3N4NV19_9FLAO|nr:hypothetical protein [Aureibaculum marinum]RPE00213.1 hypothetical protein EGM88_02820 [Aureibaculum marinum]